MGHNIIFNGVNSADYGILISGAGTYATPERDIQSIPVPGRNGDIQIDNGRYNNIQVRFEAGLSRNFETNYLPFLRELLSAPLYSRLEDSYHPDEFRLATFRSEMVPDVGTIMRSGKFELVFDCMPQRFLKSGETEIDLNFTEGATPGTAWDVKADLDNDAQTQVDDLNLMDQNVIFPSFTLTRNAEFVYLKSPHNNYRWVYPNNHILYTGRYDICTMANKLDAGDEFHVAATTSPFLSVWDEQGEIYTPSYFGTVINNPTEYPAVPIIKVYLDQNTSLALNYFDTAFGFDADNYVIYRQYAENNDSGLSLSEKTIYIDCESMDAYAYDITGDGYYNHNKAAIFNGQITIPPGRSVLRISNLRADFDHVDKITLIPRWWTI